MMSHLSSAYSLAARMSTQELESMLEVRTHIPSLQISLI